MILSMLTFLVWSVNISNEEELLQSNFNTIYKVNPAKAMQIPCILPTTEISQINISSLYGYRKHPVQGTLKHHSGIDIAVRNVDVVTTASGIVKEVGYNKGYGNYVIIDHLNGYKTLYGHLSSIFVSQGDRLTIATPIGKSGSTGTTTGEHIHYEVIKYDKKVNPISYLLLMYDNLRSHNKEAGN